MNKKIINNAISAYFWLWWLLLFPSKKENINHIFVKKHSKTASFIHFCMILTYIIFISYSLWSSISILWFQLNHMLASWFFLFLFWCILYWVYKAHNEQLFTIKEISDFTHTSQLIEIKNSTLNEHWILTFILSLIPFLGFLLKGRFAHYNNVTIENNIKLNFIITFIASILFCFEHENLWWLLILIYFIFIGFYGLILIAQNNILTFHLEKIPSIIEIRIYSIALIKYLKNYFFWKSFLSLQSIVDNQFFIEKTKIESNQSYINSLATPKIPNFFIYIPYINIITLFDINTKNKNHIINGLIISILSWILVLFQINNYQIFILMILFYCMWYLENKTYKMPFLFWIYDWISYIWYKLFSWWKKIKNMQNEIQEVTFEVEK